MVLHSSFTEGDSAIFQFAAITILAVVNKLELEIRIIFQVPS